MNRGHANAPELGSDPRDQGAGLAHRDAREVRAHSAGLLIRVDDRRTRGSPHARRRDGDRVMRASDDALATACARLQESRLGQGSGRTMHRDQSVSCGAPRLVASGSARGDLGFVRSKSTEQEVASGDPLWIGQRRSLDGDGSRNFAPSPSRIWSSWALGAWHCVQLDLSGWLVRSPCSPFGP